MEILFLAKSAQNPQVKHVDAVELLKEWVNQVRYIISREYPSIKTTHGTTVYLGRTMKTLGYERTDRSHIAYHKAIPLKAA